MSPGHRCRQPARVEPADRRRSSAAGGALPWLLRLDAPDLRHGYWRALLLACLLLPMVQPWRAAPAATVEVLAFEPSGIAPAVSGTAVPAAGQRLVPGPAAAHHARARGSGGRPGDGRPPAARVAGSRADSAPPDSADGCGPTSRASGRRARHAGAQREPKSATCRRSASRSRSARGGQSYLLPETLRRHPDAVRRAVLVHELWHVRRRDWLWVVIEEVVRAAVLVPPGHPLARVAGPDVARRGRRRADCADDQLPSCLHRGAAALRRLTRSLPGDAFARRRHLFQRVLLISKEAVMSSRRIVASCAAMGAVVVIGGWYGVGAFPLVAAPAATQAQSQPAQPRDLRPGEPRPASARETALAIRRRG